MSGTYFSVGDKVNIKQTDIEIKCEGSDQFAENQVIGIFIPPSVSLYSGKDTTLNFDVLIKQTGDTPTKVVLDAITGANGLFSKCTVYAGNRTQILETLDHYSTWCSVKYSYDTNESIRSRRAVVEGCGEWMPSSRGTFGTSKSVQNNHMYSPYIEQANKDVDPTTTITSASPFIKASVSIPIHTGLFQQNTKAVPNLLMQGTYLELTCESYAKVFRVLDGTARHRRTALNPVFYGVSTGGLGWGGTTAVASSSIDAGGTTYNNGTFTNVATTSDGSGTGCTLDITVAGGIITVADINQGGIDYDVGDTLVPDATDIGAGDGALDITVGSIGSASVNAFWTQKWNSQLDPQHSPFQVGQRLALYDLTSNTTATFTPDLVVTSIEAGGDPDYPIKYNVNSCAPDVDIESTTLTAPEWVVIQHPDTLTPTYELSNVRLVVRQLEVDGYEQSMMKKMKSGGQILYDIPSVACVLTSATKGELQTSMPISCEHAKARSIVSVPTDNEKVYTIKENCDSNGTYIIDQLEFNPSSQDHAITNHSDRSGVSGIGDFLSSYNYIVSGKTQPSRKVNTNKSSSRDKGMNMEHISELEKGLMQSHGVVPRSFAQFKSNFCVARALTLDPNTIFNGIGEDIRLVCRYEETTQPQKNKLWKHFISHIKTVSIEGANIQVQN